MNTSHTIIDRIEKHYATLSKKQQKVANFILNHPSFVGTHAAAEVGNRAGTSETTVIRFCYALGLSGYAELQKQITLYVFNQTTSSTLGNYMSTKRELFQDDKLIEKALGNDIAKIDRIEKQVDKELFEEATRKLHQAKKVFIIGAGASQFAANWLHFTMNILRPNVSLIETSTPELIRTFQEMDEQSVLLVISLHRYYKEPIQVAEYLQNQNIPVIAVTDSKLAPIHEYSTHAFVLEQVEKSTIDLMPALISFLNLLVTGMMTFDPDYYNEQRVNYDDFSQSFIGERWS